MNELSALVLASGFGTGLVIGMTGMGGGMLMTPLLVLVFGVAPASAVGTNLVYSSATKLAGGWQHWRQGTVDARIVRHLLIGSLPACALGAVVLGLFFRAGTAATDRWILRMIAVSLIVSAGLLLRPLIRGAPRIAGSDSSDGTDRRSAWVVAAGAIGGLVVTLTSIGSGSLIIALLVMLAPISARKLVGTSVAHAVVLVAAAGAAHLAIGHVEVGLATRLLVGSVPGALVGSRIARWVPQRALQAGLAALLGISAIQLL